MVGPNIESLNNELCPFLPPFFQKHGKTNLGKSSLFIQKPAESS